MSKIIRFLFVINLITITEVNANKVIEHIVSFSNWRFYLYLRGVI